MTLSSCEFLTLERSFHRGFYFIFEKSDCFSSNHPHPGEDSDGRLV